MVQTDMNKWTLSDVISSLKHWRAYETVVLWQDSNTHNKAEKAKIRHAKAFFYRLSYLSTDELSQLADVYYNQSSDSTDQHLTDICKKLCDPKNKPLAKRLR